MKTALKMILITAALITTAPFAASAENLGGIVTSGETALGTVLVNDSGMTLYSFDKDSDGKSACNGGCAKAWPPLLASSSVAETGNYTKITRDDGNQQWAYKGMPLYGWVQDKKPGDVTGDKFKGVWHVVKP
ncbi:hypothetical protein WH96_17290 [Kiloniella spongiae]|uniref:Lipoprotein n=1 Tax=Kiloniella spongiae TaxID=1489064 RepID=A0A0H2MB21_9PROT|nr:hypothetical protein [Kiloniella spongiae]KLN59508.1 hypothetical protein WH96_17290 [Kiloniella spongiae]